MTSDLKTPDPLRDTTPDGAHDASADNVHEFARPEFETPDLDRDEADQSAGKAVVDPFTIARKPEIQP